MSFEQAPIGTNDFGAAFYRCRCTGRVVLADQVTWVGSTLPNLPKGSVRYAAWLDAEGIEARKAERRAFDEMDANCNTCHHLRRVPHAKGSSGILRGVCGIGQRPGEMSFFADDHMGMPCWKARESNPTKTEVS